MSGNSTALSRTIATLFLQRSRKARDLTPQEQANVKLMRSAKDVSEAVRLLEQQPEVAPMLFSLYTSSRQMKGKVLFQHYADHVTPPGAKVDWAAPTNRISLELQLHDSNPNADYGGGPRTNSVNLRLVESFKSGVTYTRYFDTTHLGHILAVLDTGLTPRELASKFKQAIEHPERSKGIGPESLLQLTRAVRKDLKNDGAVSHDEVKADLAPLLDAFHIPMEDRGAMVRYVAKSVSRQAEVTKKAFLELAETGAGFKLDNN